MTVILCPSPFLLSLLPASYIRFIYIATTSLSAFFSLLQLMLISGLNADMGIPNLAFATGDSAIWSFVLYIQFLPMCIMSVTSLPSPQLSTLLHPVRSFAATALFLCLVLHHIFFRIAW